MVYPGLPKQSSAVFPTDIDREIIAARAAPRVLVTAPTSRAAGVVALRIHMVSCRAGSPFVRTRARDLPEGRGALTVACATILDGAAGGSVLIGNVEDMRPRVQDDLIDVLAELALQRPPATAVAFVFGTTVSLAARIAAGSFSSRLFYRLNVIHLVVAGGRWPVATA